MISTISFGLCDLPGLRERDTIPYNKNKLFMEVINNLPDSSGYRTDFCYSKSVPTLISCNTGAASEIARWVLDRNHILYANETHALWKIQSLADKATGKKIKQNYPVLKMTDAFIYGTESIIMFWEKKMFTAG
jgi:hypothetical protein